MTSKQLRQLWFTVGAVLFYFSFNFLSWSQRWTIGLPGLSFTNQDPVVANYFGILVCGPILAVELLITRQYVRRSQSALWAARIPTFFDPEPEFTSTDTKVLQVILYAGVLAFSEIAQIHFFEKFMNSEITYQDKGITPGLSKLTYFVWPWHAFDRGYKFFGCAYFPFWEPWAILLGELLLLWLFIKASLDILRLRKTRVSNSETNGGGNLEK